MMITVAPGGLIDSSKPPGGIAGEGLCIPDRLGDGCPKPRSPMIGGRAEARSGKSNIEAVKMAKVNFLIWIFPLISMSSDRVDILPKKIGRPDRSR